jgi:hypothetical protein
VNLGPDEIGLAVAGIMIGLPIGFAGAMFVMGLCRAAHRGDVLSETIDDKLKQDQILRDRAALERARSFFAEPHRNDLPKDGVHTDGTHQAQPGAHPRPGSSTSKAQ